MMFLRDPSGPCVGIIGPNVGRFGKSRTRQEECHLGGRFCHIEQENAGASCGTSNEQYIQRIDRGRLLVVSGHSEKGLLLHLDGNSLPGATGRERATKRSLIIVWH